MPLDTGGGVHPYCFGSALARMFNQVSKSIEAAVKSIAEMARAWQEGLNARST
jgi:hypothetical protein